MKTSLADALFNMAMRMNSRVKAGPPAPTSKPHSTIRYSVLALILCVYLIDTPARSWALELSGGAALARPSTFFITISYTDCETGFAETATASGFIVGAEGVVLTAAHPFYARSKICRHNVRQIKGVQIRETGPTASPTNPVTLVLDSRQDPNVDAMLLRIDGPIPKAMLPQWVCFERRPAAGEAFFAFGYPHGNPLTPLLINFSRTDIRNGYWVVSGLTSEGMSGGPVLDSEGNAVGFIQGGLLDQEGHVLAVRYIVPLSLTRTLLSSTRLRINCGYHEFPQLKSFSDDVRAGVRDSTICGLGTPPGFTTRYTDSNKKSISIHVDNASVSEQDKLGGFEASRFYLTIEKLSIRQYGLDHPEFDPSKDIMACIGASQWLREGNDPDLGDNIIFKLFKATRSNNQLRPLDHAACLASSGWASFLGGATDDGAPPDYISVPISAGVSSDEGPTIDEDGRVWHQLYPMKRFPLSFSRVQDRYRGVTFVPSIERSLALAESGGNEEFGKVNGVKGLFDSASATRLLGVRAACYSYNNTKFDDFKRICRTLVERALRKEGNDAAECLEYQRY